MLELEVSRDATAPGLVSVRLFDGEQLLAQRTMDLYRPADLTAWTDAARAMACHNMLGYAEPHFMRAVMALFPAFGRPVEGVVIE